MATLIIAGVSVVADVDHNEHDTDSAETEILRRTDQNEIIVGTDDSKGAAPSIAESSEQTLDPIAASPFNLPDLDDRGLEMIDISKVTTAKILDKRLSQSGVEYKCELGPLWWKGADGTRSYPEVRDRTCTKETCRYIKGEKAKAFGNISALSV